MFNFDWVSIFIGFPAEVAVFLIAMIPIAELRVALPLALAYYKLPVLTAYLIAVLGNLIPVIFILLFIGPVSDWLIKRSRLFELFFKWLFERTRNKFIRKYEKYGLIALTIFVAIPLPITGAWTGSLAAWLFGIEIKKAFTAIALGVMIAGIIVYLVTFGSLEIFDFLVKN
jgi:uncharacterized membrane protein